MKISVSIPDEDVATLDAYAETHQLPSRSATIRQAIRMLRRSELIVDYVAAFEDWSDEDAEVWDAVAGDGLETD